MSDNVKVQTVVQLEVYLEDGELDELTDNGSIEIREAVERQLYGTFFDSKAIVTIKSIASS